MRGFSHTCPASEVSFTAVSVSTIAFIIRSLNLVATTESRTERRNPAVSVVQPGARCKPIRPKQTLASHK
jgi:hypothetical protein